MRPAELRDTQEGCPQRVLLDVKGSSRRRYEFNWPATSTKGSEAIPKLVGKEDCLEELSSDLY